MTGSMIDPKLWTSLVSAHLMSKALGCLLCHRPFQEWLASILKDGVSVSFQNKNSMLTSHPKGPGALQAEGPSSGMWLFACIAHPHHIPLQHPEA